MGKLTKIIATIGPSCDKEDQIRELISNGVNIFRFNFKHNTVEWHAERIELVNKIADSMGIPVGTLIDLQGPEIRLTTPDGNPISVEKDETVVLSSNEHHSNPKRITITHMDVLPHLNVGQKVVVDDGAITFTVEEVGEDCVIRAHNAGTLANRKSFNIPGADFPFPVLIDRDFEGLQLAARNEVDFVALSFVRSSQDLLTTKAEMRKFNVTAKVVAKIETQKALDNLDAIIDEAEAVMVARGDLGVELPKEQVPFYQKIIIKKCIEKGIPVITATQMLQSMIDAPYPTRAEVSDVANAAYDLTDAVMLSGETAQGKYPLQAVQTMNETVVFNETKFPQDTRNKFTFAIPDTTSMICNSAYALYLQSIERHDDIGGFIVFTQSGRTARLLSRYRPVKPIFVFAPNKAVRDSVTMNFAVEAFEQQVLEKQQVTNDEILTSIRFLEEKQLVKKGQRIIVLHGDVWAEEGGTSTIKIVTV